MVDNSKVVGNDLKTYEDFIKNDNPVIIPKTDTRKPDLNLPSDHNFSRLSSGPVLNCRIPNSRKINSRPEEMKLKENKNRKKKKEIIRRKGRI